MADEFDQYKAKPAAATDEFDQYKKSAPAPGFLSSLGSGIGKAAKGELESWKHGGVGVGQESSFQQGFNPFRPIDTAGYLVPQPVKDIFHPKEGQSHAGSIGEATGEALPYVTAPMGVIEHPGELATAPIRGAAKTINAGIRNAPTVGTIAGGIGGLSKGAAYGEPLYGGMIGAYMGHRLGNYVQKLPPIPGEEFGLSKSFAGGKMEPTEGPQRAVNVGAGQPRVGPAQLPPVGIPPKGGPIPERAAAPVAEAPKIAKPTVSIPDQIATAKGLGFKNLGEAISKFGQTGWEKVIGEEQSPSLTANIGPIGKPTPFSIEERQPLPPDPMHRRLSPSAQKHFDIQQENADMQEMEEAHERNMADEQGRQLAIQLGTPSTKGDVITRSRGISAPRNYAEQVAGRSVPGATGLDNRTLGEPMRAGQGHVDYVTGKPIESEYEVVPRKGQIPILRKTRPK